MPTSLLKRVKKMQLVEYPFRMLWILLEDGTLLSATLIGSNNGTNAAFSKHILGGDNPIINDITLSYNNNHELLYLHVTRNNKEGTISTLEVIEFNSFDNIYKHGIVPNYNSLYYLDCYQNAELKNNQINNLYIFHNQNIAMVSKDNSIYFGVERVADSVVKFFNLYSDQIIIVGYNFCSIYQSQPLEDAIENNSFAVMKKINELHISTINSSGICLLSRNISYNLKDIINYSYIEAKEYMHIKTISTEFPWHVSPTITIIQDNPKAMNILSIKILVITN
jgi:hypothetical protein